MADIVGFRPDDARRIARAVRHVEGMPVSQPDTPGAGGVRPTTNVQRLKVTGDPATEFVTVAGTDYRPADVLRWDVTAGAWSVVSEASPVKVFHPSGSELAEDAEVEARMVGVGTFDAVPYVVFEVIAAGSSGTCTLPASAAQLAQDSPQGEEYWTADDVLQIVLSEECCHFSIPIRFCKDDGTDVVCKRFTVYTSKPVKIAQGPTEQCPSNNWNQPCEGAPDL